ILIPAFSTKGFRMTSTGESEIKKILFNTAEVLTESMLISAYDLYYEYIPSPEDFPCRPEVMVVDSGGYETSDAHEHSAIYRHTGPINEWDQDKLRTVLNKWPKYIPAMFVSFDKGDLRQSVRWQIDNAAELLGSYPDQLSIFLLKPETSSQLTLRDALKGLRSCLKDLNSFDVVGVTETELGASVLDRMVSIAELRRDLDEANVGSPIQVFGGLDPLSSYLYFLSGAELFDGLSWIRYAYRDGCCVYAKNYGALEMGISHRDTLIQSTIWSRNIYELVNMQEAMKDFLLDMNFGKLCPHSEMIREAYDRLKRKVGGE
ncbi:MAG: hypothetical protein ACRD5H_11655, partial [Nitrososphaerales archaeon]